MSKRKRQIIISVTAVGMAGVLAAGSLLHTSIQAQASAAMMPGIESIVKENTDEKPLRILEIVDKTEEAEIGYYVAGQEPYIKLYKHELPVENDSDPSDEPAYEIYQTLEEGLSKIPTKEERKGFAENSLWGDLLSTGIKDVRDDFLGLCGESVQDFPLSFTNYEERYFLSDAEKNDSDWKELKLSEIRSDDITGSYEKNRNGTGDYTKQEIKYYPVRENAAADTGKGEFNENIESFGYAGMRAPYSLQFQSVPNNEIDSRKTQSYIYQEGGYGYYENVYRELTVSQFEGDFFDTIPGEALNEDGQPVQNFPENVLIEQEGFSQEGAASQVEIFDSVDLPNGSGAEEVGFGDGTAAEEVGFGDIQDSTGAVALPDDNQGFTDEIFGDNEEVTDDGAETSSILESGWDETISKTNPRIYFAESIRIFPNYRYQIYGTLDRVKKQAEATALAQNQAMTAGKTWTPSVGDITLSSDGESYLYWSTDDSGVFYTQNLYYVEGLQAVPYRNVQLIEDDVISYPYYFVVDNKKFCCSLKNSADSQNEKDPENYEYYGSYFAYYPENADPYIAAEEGKGTYYTLEAEYKLTPGKGDYDFVYDTEKPEVKVEVDHIYYKGGYSNHDWFKRYVMHLDPGDGSVDATLNTEEKLQAAKEEFDNFSIIVDTKTTAELAELLAVTDMEGITIQSEGKSYFADDQAVDMFASEDIPESAVEDRIEASGFEESGFEASGLEASGYEEQGIFQEDPQMEIIGDDFSEEVFSAEDVNSQLNEEGAEFQADQEEEEKFSLENYDLIYINGVLSYGLSENILACAQNKTACIVNMEKSGQNTDLLECLSAFTESDYGNHYVSKNVYFYSRSSAAEQIGFLNNSFNKIFAGAEDSDGGFADDLNSLNGFEEITEYIQQENKLRQLQQKEENIVLLEEGISQARVVEYILNFSYKRELAEKKEIKVLEIQPGVSNWEMSQEKVWTLLGYTKSVWTCCETEQRKGEYLADGNSNTWWHSNFAGQEAVCPVYQNGGYHYFIYDLGGVYDITGFIYQARATNTNGIISEFQVEVFDTNPDEKGDHVRTHEGKYSIKELKEGEKAKVDLSEKARGRFIKVTALRGRVDEKFENRPKFASCAEFSPITTGEEVVDNPLYFKPQVKIVRMTASEFVGRTEDLNAEYDMIYIGDKCTRDSLINGGGNMLYSHVGGALSVLDIYTKKQNDKYVEVPRNYLYNCVGLLNKDISGNEVTRGTAENGVGLFRGSGNDITQNKLNELYNFVNSGYPVLVADSLYSNGSSVNGQINTNLVDSTSYYGKFLSGAGGYSNVMTMSEAEKNDIKFLMNLPKPGIVEETFVQPPDARQKENGIAGDRISDESEGLTYVFTIEDKAAATPATTRYNVELFLDLNNDGVFASAENQSSYIVVSCDGKIILPGEAGYELEAGKEYTLTRRVPLDYKKLITWKLQLTVSNNKSIRTSYTGYAKRKAGENKTDINVLQIKQNNKTSTGVDKKNGNTWDLSKDSEFIQDLSSIEDFNIIITSMTIDDFVKEFESNKNLLNGYQMLIIGFADVYDNIPEREVQAILNFISVGKSVIFAHDTTSYINRTGDIKKVQSISDNPETDIVFETLDPYLYNDKVMSSDWGYYLNQYLRSAVGMDRYGITSTEIGADLRAGNAVTDHKGYDAAYKVNDPTSTYVETQGFTNIRLAEEDIGQNAKTGKVSGVNKGTITQYPYRINEQFDVAQTHGQYYQLALEQDSNNSGYSDIVVWYCLAGNNKNYKDSPNDVRNNYYFYSKGTVIYTGVGHNGSITDMERKLFINAIVAAASVTVVQPEIEFLEYFQPDSRTIENTYYTADLTSGNKGILNNGLDIYFQVKEYNLTSSSFAVGAGTPMDLTLQLELSDMSGPVNLEIGKDVQLYEYDGTETGKKPDSDTKIDVNKVYRIHLQDPEKWLNTGGLEGYLSNLPLRVTVNKTSEIYGKPTPLEATNVINIRQRALFNMD